MHRYHFFTNRYEYEYFYLCTCRYRVPIPILLSFGLHESAINLEADFILSSADYVKPMVQNKICLQINCTFMETKSKKYRYSVSANTQIKNSYSYLCVKKWYRCISSLNVCSVCVCVCVCVCVWVYYLYLCSVCVCVCLALLSLFMFCMCVCVCVCVRVPYSKRSMSVFQKVAMKVFIFRFLLQ